MRNFGQLLIKNQEKLQEELSELRESGAEAGSVKALSIWLEKSLTFKKVKDVGINPFLELPFAEGTWISKKMSYFLRHNMPHGCVMDMSRWVGANICLRERSLFSQRENPACHQSHV